ncbi:MAG: tyrosine-type recombinase/integrase [Lachnospirales bacterium]
MDTKNIKDEQTKAYFQRLREQEKKLPSFVVSFFRGIESYTAVTTRLGYSYDLGIFFYYLVNNEDDFLHKEVKSLTSSDLNKINIDHLENFVSFLNYYERTNNDNKKEYTNSERGLSRKISAVKTMLKYFYKKRVIDSNPGELITMPKIKQKAIIRLDNEEVSNMLDTVENGTNLSKKSQEYHNKTKERDLAIVTLFLGTGMRISELIGINLKSFDFDNNSVLIVRKGGDEQIIYFNDEVKETLLTYQEIRKSIIPESDHIDAFFLSLQNRRITPRAVQNLVKKYAKVTTPLKKITPHKLRSTYGTKLYNESGDIYLVASVLGHKDVNTTRKHYAEIEEEKRKLAPSYIKLRAKTKE